MLEMVIDDIYRSFLLKVITANKGRVVEVDDKIICYVKESGCKKLKGGYSIYCEDYTKINENLVDKYKLNKKVYYVIENFSFDKAVYIYGAKNTYICINNCNFNKGFVLNCDNFCSINSSYITDELFVHIFANKLELNDVFINSSSYYLFYNFYVKMKAKDVNIKNCKIGNSKQRVKISVDSFNLIVDDSELVGEDIFIDSSNISFNNGLMMADKCVTVKGSSESNLDIVSPNIICNNKYKKRYKKRNNE